MWNLLSVGCGGFVGAIARYTLSGWVHQRVDTVFPLGTLAVNVLGCVMIGALMTMVEDRQYFSPGVRLLIITGFLGSLTTFSTFGYETVELMRDSRMFYALLSVGANLVLGLAGVIIGRVAVRLLGV